MITKKQGQFIKSLQIKKNRKEEQLFTVEGAKSVLELLGSDYTTKTVYVTPLFLQDYNSELQKANVEYTILPPRELAGLGAFKSNDAALAVVEMKPDTPLNAQVGEYVFMLDELNDPGNLGTIIRIADWFGIRKIVCSENTVDFYNPKVIAAAKGSFTRVQTHYTNLAHFLETNTMPVYGADMEGADVHTYSFTKEGYLLMGSEANGISPELLPFITAKVRVPGWGGAESLNVAVAAAIICDNMKRSLTHRP